MLKAISYRPFKKKNKAESVTFGGIPNDILYSEVLEKVRLERISPEPKT